VNDRALPYIGRDAVKIGSPDGTTLTFVVRGTTALASNREKGTADDSHTF
jgi:hypothetical protein